MPYVQYDTGNAIVAIFGAPQSDSTAFVADDDPTVIAFRAALQPPPSVDFLAFLGLFTGTEETAIFTARRTDIQVDKFVTMAAGAGSLQLSDSRVVAGINYLVSASLLTGARAPAPRAAPPPAPPPPATAVLAGEAPPASS